jgi:uncharacterized protein
MHCPICKKPVNGFDDSVAPNQFFPFCSSRCKLIDLGRWIDGKYQIPIEPDEDVGENPPPSDDPDAN